MPAGNRDEVRRSFASQAATFEDPERHFRRHDVFEWLIAHAPICRGDVVLEVAAGTAIFGRALAPSAAYVVACDLSPEMLATGCRAAADSGLANVRFQQADATALPFVDHSFDRVVSRLALHHFEDPALPLREMARVCRATGTITVVDMVVSEPATQDLFNNLEALRDPTHTRAITRAELRDAMASTGASIVHSATRENIQDGERWLEQTGTPDSHAERIRAAWLVELDGGPATGMEPRWMGGRIELTTTGTSWWRRQRDAPNAGYAARCRAERRS